MGEALSIGVDLVVWVTLAVKLRDLVRDKGNPALRALCLMVACLGTTLMFSSSAVNHAVDRLSGIPSFRMLLQHVTTMGSAFLGQVMFLRLAYPRDEARLPERVRAGWLALAVSGMVVLFALAPRAGRDTGMGPDSASVPATAAYLVIFLGYLMIAFGQLMRLCVRYARQTDRVFLRRGLWLACAGVSFELGYLVHKAGYLGARMAGIVVPWKESAVSTWLILPAALLVMIGCVLPSWGPKAVAARDWFADFRHYRRLGPLWRDVSAAFPEVVLPMPDVGGGRFGFGDLGVRLYRRVIEIRDGQLALRPYLDPVPVDEVRLLGRRAGLSGEALSVLVEAAQFTVALRARSTGDATTPDDVHPDGTAAGQDTVAPEPIEPSGAVDDVGRADLPGEVARLVRVATAYRSSPLVRRSAGAMSGATISR